MLFPKKLKAKDLKHPKDVRSAFNGDKRRSKEDQGSLSSRESQGLTVVVGSNPPSNFKPANVKVSPKFVSNAQPMSYQRPPTAAQRKADEAREAEANKKPLTTRQKRLLKNKT
jgi:hypothetical protein